MNVIRMALSLALMAFGCTQAVAATYDLVIDRTTVRIDGTERRVFSINGQIAGPTLRWTEGEEVLVNVTNRLNEDTSIHSLASSRARPLPIASRSGRPAPTGTIATPAARSRRACTPPSSSRRRRASGTEPIAIMW
jgi:hypothetical protein